jgi:site-specific DNA recombinase
MSNVGRDYIACGAARKQGTCTNTQGIRRSELECLVLDALRDQLMAPDLVAEFVTAFTAEWNRLAGQASAGRDGLTRDLAAAERKLKGLIDGDRRRLPGARSAIAARRA